MPWARNIVLGLTFSSITNYESILKFVIFISHFKYTFVTYEVYSLYSMKIAAVLKESNSQLASVSSTEEKNCSIARTVLGIIAREEKNK